MKKIFLTTSLLFAFSSLAQAELASPVLLKPDNAANLPLKKAAKFTWQKVTGASKYRLIFSDDKSFSNYDANKFKCLNTKTCFMYTITSPSYNVAASKAILKTEGNYFWQVQSVSSKDRSQLTTATTNASEVRSFSVGKVPVVINTTSSPYTKIANNGSELPDSAELGTKPTDWACTKDNKTGLIWEVKTAESGLRATYNFYSWYEPDANKNGGGEGYQNQGSCKDSKCDTYAYTNAVNTQGLCGASNWRIPTKSELEGLVYCSDGKRKTLGEEEYGSTCTYAPNNPTINETYFPDHPRNGSFWSSSSKVPNNGDAWYVNFNSGYSGLNDKSSSTYVRLVR